MEEMIGDSRTPARKPEIITDQPRHKVYSEYSWAILGGTSTKTSIAVWRPVNKDRRAVKLAGKSSSRSRIASDVPAWSAWSKAIDVFEWYKHLSPGFELPELSKPISHLIIMSKATGDALYHSEAAYA